MTNVKKTILLTGGTGYLGSHLVSEIVDHYNIIVLKRISSPLTRIKKELNKIKFYDIENTKINQIFLENSIDIVLHCATHYGRKCTDPTEIVEANLLLPLTLLHNVRIYKIPCFINTDTILDKGINSYSLSKSHFNDWLKILSSDTICINLKLEHFYGPLDDPSKFVTYMIHALLRKEKEINLTKGEQLRYFLHIDDVVKAFMIIIENIFDFAIGYHEIHIGAKECISIRCLTELIKKFTNNNCTNLNFGAIPYRKNEIMKPNLDTSILEKLGWKEAVTLKSGLEKTIKIEREVLGL